MKRFVKILLRTTLVLFILLNIITVFHAWKLTRFYERHERPAVVAAGGSWETLKTILFGARAYKQANQDPGPEAEKLYLNSSDGLRLEAWYIPTRTAASAKGTVILFHGHGSRKSAVLDESAAFRELGYHTLLVDFRAHGNSAGQVCTIGYRESEDVLLAWRHIRDRGEKKVILWGISMGAAAITCALDRYPEIKPEKLILEMPFASLHEAARGRLRIMGLPGEPLGTLVTFWGGLVTGTWAFDLEPAVFAKQIRTPTLLQWGRHDPRVLEHETNAIYEALAGPKQKVVYELSGHESLCDKEHEKWMQTVSSFLNQ